LAILPTGIFIGKLPRLNILPNFETSFLDSPCLDNQLEMSNIDVDDGPEKWNVEQLFNIT